MVNKFLLSSASLYVSNIYDDDSKDWRHDVDFKSGSFNCSNHYGKKNYTLSEEELIHFEIELLATHALEWSSDDFDDGFDVPRWSFKACYADGREVHISAMIDSYKYNYFKLERLFLETEATLRGGDSKMFHHSDSIPLEQYIDIEESLLKYPEEFKSLEGKKIKYNPSGLVKIVQEDTDYPEIL